MSNLLVLPRQLAMASGAFAPNTLYFYEPGTSTPKAVYDVDGDSLGTSVAADANGRYPAIYGDGLYKVVEQTSTGVTVWTADNVAGFETGSGNGSLRADLASETSGKGASLVGLTQGGSVQMLQFGTIAEAKAAEMPVGFRTRVYGYLSAGDMPAADYLVVASATGTADGCYYHDMTNGNQLKLLHGNRIDVRWAGAKCDGDGAGGGTNDFDAIAAAVDGAPDNSQVVGSGVSRFEITSRETAESRNAAKIISDRANFHLRGIGGWTLDASGQDLSTLGFTNYSSVFMFVDCDYCGTVDVSLIGVGDYDDDLDIPGTQYTGVLVGAVRGSNIFMLGGHVEGGLGAIAGWEDSGGVKGDGLQFRFTCENVQYPLQAQKWNNVRGEFDSYKVHRATFVYDAVGFDIRYSTGLCLPSALRITGSLLNGNIVCNLRENKTEDAALSSSNQIEILPTGSPVGVYAEDVTVSVNGTGVCSSLSLAKEGYFRNFTLNYNGKLACTSQYQALFIGNTTSRSYGLTLNVQATVSTNTLTVDQYAYIVQNAEDLTLNLKLRDLSGSAVATRGLIIDNAAQVNCSGTISLPNFGAIGVRLSTTTAAITGRVFTNGTLSRQSGSAPSTDTFVITTV